MGAVTEGIVRSVVFVAKPHAILRLYSLPSLSEDFDLLCTEILESFEPEWSSPHDESLVLRVCSSDIDQSIALSCL